MNPNKKVDDIMKFHNKNIYTEATDKGNKYRADYVRSLDEYVTSLINPAIDTRKNFVSPEKMKDNAGFYRNQLVKMLGNPLDKYEYSVSEYSQEYIGEDDFCKIYRMQINTIGNIMFYGILCLPLVDGKHPLVIAQHGGWGSPEFLCGMHGKNSYDNISKIALENGCAVFCPQLLLWNNDSTNSNYATYPIEYDRFTLDTRLKQYGGSIIALEIFNIMKSIDCLTAMECIDENNISMLGSSYGGYFTLYTTAIDTRIKAAYACAFFNDRNYVLKNDWVYFNSANMFHDAEVAGLCAPRALFIDVGKDDKVFDWHTSVNESEKAREFYKVHNAEDKFCFNLWNGGHKFDINGINATRFFEYIKNQ